MQHLSEAQRKEFLDYALRDAMQSGMSPAEFASALSRQAAEFASLGSDDTQDRLLVNRSSLPSQAGPGSTASPLLQTVPENAPTVPSAGGTRLRQFQSCFRVFLC